MPGETSPAITQIAAFAAGEEQCLCGDTNCHSKSITVPVTVVLGLISILYTLPAKFQNPRQMSFFPRKTQGFRPRYMHFGKRRQDQV
jgi:hypothetical protein